jgi:DNA invertase Pin-like site-specific DNA recombinase
MPYLKPETATERTVALCYLRKSIVRSGVDYASIELQRAGIADFCLKRGWTPEWFEDAEGHSSGRHETGRPAWLRLKRRVDDPDVVAVVGYKFDRLGRSVKDLNNFIQYCISHGVGVQTVDGTINVSGHINAIAYAQINMLATFAQFESDIASDRMRERVAAKDSLGINHGKPPFGMTRTGEGNDARFIANEDAGTVIRCLELYAGGASYDQCAARLNRDGLTFRDRAGRPCEFGRESVRTIVGNVLRYSGYHIPQNGYDAKANRITLSGEGDHADRWAAAIGAWRSPAVDVIVDRQLANAVIERRYRNTNTGRPAGAALYLLTPIASWRGRRLRGQLLPGGRVYRTYGSGASFNADEVERDFLHHMAGLHMTDELRAGVRQVLIARMSEARLGMVEERIAEMKSQRSMLLDLLLSRAIDRTDYNDRFAKIEATIRTLEDEMRAPAEVEAAMTRLSEFGAMVAHASAHHQKRVIHSTFARVGLNDDGEVSAVDWKPWAQQLWGSLRPDAPNVTNFAEGGDSRQRLYFPALPASLLFWAVLPPVGVEVGR